MDTVFDVVQTVFAVIGGMAILGLGCVIWDEFTRPTVRSNERRAGVDREKVERDEFEDTLTRLRELETEAAERLRNLRDGR